MAFNKINRRLRIKRRVRKVISGTQERPRITVFRSNKQIYAQIVDDTTGVTIVSASSSEKEFAEKEFKGKIQQASLVGEVLAKRAIEAGITNCVFDRNGYLYHGRVKSLADGARNGGLNF
jgi:large subunit ribosomal protein L18